MESCEQVRANIPQYVDNDLDKQSVKAIEQHLAGCEDCQMELHAYKAMMDVLQTMPVEEVPEGLHQQVMQRIQNMATPIDLITKSPNHTEKPVQKKLDLGFDWPKPKVVISPLLWRRFGGIAAGVFGVFLMIGAGVTLWQESINPMMKGSDEAPRMAASPMVEMAVPEMAVLEDEAPAGAVVVETDMMAAKQMEPTNDMLMSRMAPMAAEDFVVQSLTVSVTVEDKDLALHTLNSLPGTNAYMDVVYDESRNTTTDTVVRSINHEDYAYVKEVLHTLGTVTEAYETAEIINSRVEDTQAALNAKEQEIMRLLDLMAQSKSVETLAVVEQRLSQVEGEKEALMAQTNNNMRMASQCQVTVHFSSQSGVTAQPLTFGQKLGQSFTNSLSACVKAGQGLLVGISALILPAAAVGLCLWFGLRLAKKGKRRGGHEK